MGHIGEPAGAVVIGCKVLPIFNEHGIVEGAVRKVVHRIDGKKAVARVKELLKLAAQARPHGATVSGKKWKVPLSIVRFVDYPPPHPGRCLSRAKSRFEGFDPGYT